MITRLIWTIWTPKSSVPKKADKLNIYLSLFPMSEVPHSVSPPHARRRRLCSKVSLGHLAGRWDQYPAARSYLWMVRTDIRLPNCRIICIHRREAEMKRLDIFIEPPFFLRCGRPVSRLGQKILLMHPWDISSILPTSRWELPSADNLTIPCSICSGTFCAF